MGTYKTDNTLYDKMINTACLFQPLHNPFYLYASRHTLDKMCTFGMYEVCFLFRGMS